MLISVDFWKSVYRYAMDSRARVGNISILRPGMENEGSSVKTFGGVFCSPHVKAGQATSKAVYSMSKISSRSLRGEPFDKCFQASSSFRELVPDPSLSVPADILKNKKKKD